MEFVLQSLSSLSDSLEHALDSCFEIGENHEVDNEMHLHSNGWTRKLAEIKGEVKMVKALIERGILIPENEKSQRAIKDVSG